MIDLWVKLPYHVPNYRTELNEIILNNITVNKFRNNLKTYVEQVISDHEPLKVSRRAGDDFIVISVDDWLREQETLYVLQNNNLMNQISESIKTHSNHKGYTPTQEQINEITSI